jgi:hypothetical protein
MDYFTFKVNTMAATTVKTVNPDQPLPIQAWFVLNKVSTQYMKRAMTQNGDIEVPLWHKDVALYINGIKLANNYFAK